MKKLEQMKVNETCERAYINAMNEAHENHTALKRLRSCSAYTCETENYIILQSYKTVIAVIEKSSGICYDVLRMVYGYTSTSGKHVAKFRNDFRARSEYRYYSV